MSSAELYDPTTEAWSTAKPMQALQGCWMGGVLMTAGPLSGKVLAVGGDTGGAEIYDPSTGSWSITGSLVRQSNAMQNTITTLKDGSVLFVSWGGGPQWFHPDTETWTNPTTHKSTEATDVAILLNDGRVLVAGRGVGPSSLPPIKSAEIFNRLTSSWTKAKDMLEARAYTLLTTIHDGQVLASSGDTNIKAELYNPATDSWSYAGQMTNSDRTFGSATLLANGKVLVAGGWKSFGTSDDSAEVYTPASNPPRTAPPSTARLSLTNAGRQAKADSYAASVSADGRYMAFASDASNLVSGDSNGAADIFLLDRVTKQVRPVSKSANGDSLRPAISADGRYVAYESYASNLVGSDTNKAADIFRYDRLTGKTVRISVDASGAQADGDSINASISDDGHRIAFASLATNLVPNDANGSYDVFVHGPGNAISRESIGTTESNGDSVMPALSGDGNYVAYVSAATNLVADDSNGAYDVFVRDRVAGATSRVSLNTAGVQAKGDSWQPHISQDGRYVAFASAATNLVYKDINNVTDIFVRDRMLNRTVLKSVTPDGKSSDGPSFNPKISNDGLYVIFESYGALDASDVNGAPDVYLRLGGSKPTTTRMSVATDGTGGNAPSLAPVMTPDARYVLFESQSDNLVKGDSNQAWDVFVRDRGRGTTPTYPLSAKEVLSE